MHVLVRRRAVIDDEAGRIYGVHDAIAFDHAFRRVSPVAQIFDKSVTFDLTHVKYLHHDTLLYLAALVRFRRQQGWPTTFELPTSEGVLHYLRAWQFPSLMCAVTGVDTFDELLTPGSRRRFKKAHATYSARTKVVTTPTGGDQELLPLTYFAATPIVMLDNPFQAASIAQKTWLEQHMLSVLDRYFGKDQGKRIGTRVIQEAVLNAARHPHAALAFTASQFVQPTVISPDVKPTLQISIWDDGDTIGDTLRRVVSARRPITSKAFGQVDERLHVRLTRSNGREELKIIDASDSVLPSDFPWLTAAAFLAGVTSIPVRSPEDARSLEGLFPDDDPLPLQHRTHGGLGLYVIRRNVLDQFDGKIRYLTGNYRMSIRRRRRVDGAETQGESSSDDYDVEMSYRPRDSWPLKGNLMLIEIPIEVPIVDPITQVDEIIAKPGDDR